MELTMKSNMKIRGNSRYIVAYLHNFVNSKQLRTITSESDSGLSDSDSDSDCDELLKLDIDAAHTVEKIKEFGRRNHHFRRMTHIRRNPVPCLPHSWGQPEYSIA